MINIDIFTFIIGIVALFKGETTIAVALLYISLAFPTRVVREVEKQIRRLQNETKEKTKQNY